MGFYGDGNDGLLIKSVLQQRAVLVASSPRDGTHRHTPTPLKTLKKRWVSMIKRLL